MSHLNDKHPQYLEDYAEYERRGAQRLDGFGFVTDKATTIYNWMAWIITRNLPLNEVDNEATRAMSRTARAFVNTELVAVKRNTTRWPSMFKMLKRYLEIKAATKQVETVEDLVPRARAHRKIEKLYQQMRALEAVNK
ncbi:hypothetical protein JG688_00008145 [Phytophthora aleatoria]|uniref:Uncharacterized protein n=1 Tax=Phytophthora aleatoria TaxID=2496075 RepID=A0A8J5IYU7_9STRA|nr:hypothetical protein JG688_00008145 [Phytophthora aleatoria]